MNDPGEKGRGGRRTGGEASEGGPEIGPGGGPPDGRERQRRGSTPTEDVMDEKLRDAAPRSRPPGTGEEGELVEPDTPGAPDPSDHRD